MTTTAIPEDPDERILDLELALGALAATAEAYILARTARRENRLRDEIEAARRTLRREGGGDE